MKRYTFLAMLMASPAMAQSERYGHMMDWGYGHHVMFGPVLWLLVLGLVVAGLIWFVRRPEGGQSQQKSNALAELDIRFARGEIDAEEYTMRKKLLSA